MKINNQTKLIILISIILLGAFFIPRLLTQKTGITPEKPELQKSVCDEVIQQTKFDLVTKYEGKPAKVNFSSFPEAKMYFSAITSQASVGPNFAGHFTIAEWGCGTACGGYAIVDSINGNIVEYVPFDETNNSNSMAYNIDSRLLVLNPKSDYGQLKGKTIKEIIDIDDYALETGRVYYDLYEDGDFVTLSKLCTENAVDGINNTGEATTAPSLKQAASVTYYGYNSKISTSGEARFRWVDQNTGKIIDPNNQYAWFWAMPPKQVTDDDDLTAAWYEFVHDNVESTFKIIGTRGRDDCDYWGPDHCVENIDIQKIEVVGSEKFMQYR